MNRKFAVAALFALSSTVHAALQAGDLAFTSFNADEDGFSIVALTNIAPYTTLYFSDNEWNGGAPGIGSFNTGENIFAWVSGSETLAAGNVVRFSAIDQATRASSSGAFGLVVSGTPGFSATGDTIFAYSGNASAAPTTFITALSSENFAGSNLLGTGLINAVNAVAITPSTDFGEYIGPRAGLGSFGAYAGLINDAARWRALTTGDFATAVPNGVPFTVTAVPEPQTYALLLTGLGLVAMRLRERLRARSPMPLVQALPRLA
jgi:hypothetical protein